MILLEYYVLFAKKLDIEYSKKKLIKKLKDLIIK